MLTINTDKPYHIFAEHLEQGALDQFESAMQQPFSIKGALMPDAHQGYSLPIGAVIATKGVILPSWVGYDIGCGMCAVRTTFTKDEVREHSDKIFDEIYATVPVGFSHNLKDCSWPKGEALPCTDKTKEIFDKNGLRQLGSLGGGNHFIEIGKGASNDAVWIIIHSGSRGIGHAVATHYMRMASVDGKAREGHFGFETESKNGFDYIFDLEFCLRFALANRTELMLRIERAISKYCDGMADWNSLINRNHNHAELKDGLWIHRKGATHADRMMMGVIPGNMRDGSFIVRGKGNPDALCSSSHGAGRVLGRKEAKRVLKMVEFNEAMLGITAKVTEDTLDESPDAYKNIFDVMRMQEPMVETVERVIPMINIKG